MDHNICFAEDYPGATDRFRTFAPVRCDDPHKQPLAEPEGADHGVLSFEDVDNDGVAEAMIQSSAFRCRTAATSCYDAYRIVMRVDVKTGAWTEVERRLLSDLTIDPDD